MPGSQPVRPRRAPVAAALLVGGAGDGTAADAGRGRRGGTGRRACPPRQPTRPRRTSSRPSPTWRRRPTRTMSSSSSPAGAWRWASPRAPGTAGPSTDTFRAALPPGRATGRQMAASDNGSQWADTVGPGSSGGTGDHDPAAGSAPTSTPAPVDAPAEGPVTPAQGASLAEPGEPAFDLAAASGLRRQVFGFLPYWELSGAATKLNYDVLSTIAYFSVGANCEGQPQEEGRGRHEHHRVGRLDQLVDDGGHQRGAPAGHARRPHRVRVRLDVDPGERPEGDPRQRDRAPEPRPPGRGGRPRPWRRRRQPRLRAAGIRLRR